MTCTTSTNLYPDDPIEGGSGERKVGLDPVVGCKFTDGDPQTQLLPSKLPAGHVNLLTDLLQVAIENGDWGLGSSNNTDNTQLEQVFQNLADSIQANTDAITGLQLGNTPVGEIRLQAFRATELPGGWYYCNGDDYPIASPQGTALQGLSTNYKTDWGITEVVSNINLPDLFFTPGRGYFLRAVDGSTRQVGDIEEDAIRNIVGRVGLTRRLVTTTATDGAFNAVTPGGGAPNDNGASGSTHQGVDFDASRVVPTADENRPLNIGMTPAIYLGI